MTRITRRCEAPKTDTICGCTCNFIFYRANACNATHGIAKVFLSVCLSVWQTRAMWQNERNLCQHSYTTWKNVYPSFPIRRMVGGGRLKVFIGNGNACSHLSHGNFMNAGMDVVLTYFLLVTLWSWSLIFDLWSQNLYKYYTIFYLTLATMLCQFPAPWNTTFLS